MPISPLVGSTVGFINKALQQPQSAQAPTQLQQPQKLPQQSSAGSIIDIIGKAEKGMQESIKNNAMQLSGIWKFPNTRLSALTPEESKLGARRFKSAGATDPGVELFFRLVETPLVLP